ncbi:hypothetical protein EJV47_26620 [Hymenobacter gummosus]|uniref:Uncharacterized protein n=1 Tax=Hymenobacter gummosus TaxID=1776032 RepID=A0A431TUP2_9BACT|nr:hypothetical protein [Hymenobacter gummosus]RTQ44946.1 hypothetical protein EJV47_26620 [Hymenobacter gummosus]
MRHGFWLLAVVTVALPACVGSRPVPDVALLMQQGQLQPGTSSRPQVVRVLGRGFSQERHALHVNWHNVGDQISRWTTLDYVALGIECTMVEMPTGPTLYRLTLKPPYGHAVLDSIRLGRQRLGQLAQALERPVTSFADSRTLSAYEVQSYVSLDNVRVEARVQLDSATWNRCRRQPAVLDSIVQAAPVDRVIFSRPVS